jgi:hypothetical protein
MVLFQSGPGPVFRGEGAISLADAQWRGRRPVPLFGGGGKISLVVVTALSEDSPSPCRRGGRGARWAGGVGWQGVGQ